MKNFIFPLLASTIATFLLFNLNDAIGVFSGILWGYLNFYLIQQLTISWFKVDKSYLKIIAIILIKFPLLYLVGYKLLQSGNFSPWNLLIGFSIALIVSIQKSVSKFLKHELKSP